jgi:starch phosphorylase
VESMYETLENEIIPLYYTERGGEDVPRKWIVKMKESMRTIIPQFGTRRMVKEYVERLYIPATKPVK